MLSFSFNLSNLVLLNTGKVSIFMKLNVCLLFCPLFPIFREISSHPGKIKICFVPTFFNYKKNKVL